MKVFELSNNSRIVIHMCPFNCVKVQMLPRRKMEISFPNQSKCFYKLLLNFGCGSSWSKWRSIETVDTSKKQNYRSRWTLIPFEKLDSYIQQYLRTERFLRPPKILAEILSLHKSEDDDIKDERSIYSKPSHYIYNKRGHLLKVESIEKVAQDGLRLSCHSFEAQVTLPKKDSAEISSEYHKRKLAASNTMLEKEKPRDYEKPAPHLELKPTVERSKGIRKTRKGRRFGEGIPDGCTFDLSLSYSDSVSDEEAVDSKRTSKKESTKMTPFDYLIDEKIASKDISCSQDVIQMKSVERSKKPLKQTSEMAHHCPNISSLTITAKEIRRSQSVDSIISIESIPYHLGYLKANLSLPNFDEIIFHRRTHRLSYNTEVVRSCPEEGTSFPFWIPERENEKLCGRVYNPTPISRKLEVLKLKSKFLRNYIQSSSSQMILGSQSTDENSSILSHSYSEVCINGHTCGKRKVVLGFAKKLLEEMENEYSARHSLWIESPDKPQDTGKPAVTEKASSQNADKRITEVSSEKVSQGLKAIQQDLFYKIESGEVARYILKPHTVTEVNSPYLCGYLYFFERMKQLVINELLAERTTSEMTDVFRYFIQVAYFCVHLRDKQSTCAILSGLCNLVVLKHQALWSALHENMPNEIRILSQILHIDWNEKKHGTAKSEIPFFRSILKVLVEELPQEFTPYLYKRRRYSEFIQEWYRWKRERKKPETLEDRLTNAFSQFLTKCTGKKKHSQTVLDYTSDDPFTTRYRELAEILNFIEDCRNYYSFTTDSLPVDKDARYFLLCKKYRNNSHNPCEAESKYLYS